MVAFQVIEDRVRSMVEGRGEWPCRKGCDGCCRRLAAIPAVSAAEWELMKDAVLALGEEARERILKTSPERPVTCPLLDLSSGACRIYDVRPVACRAYGFYVERDQGLYCEIIREGVERREFEGVVWGNWEAVRPGGETKSLVEWLVAEVGA